MSDYPDNHSSNISALNEIADMMGADATNVLLAELITEVKGLRADNASMQDSNGGVISLRVTLPTAI